MRGKAYAIVNNGTVIAISLMRSNAQEILMDYALEDGAYVYNVQRSVRSHETALREAEYVMDYWHIREFNLV